ncbi:RNA-binding protein 42, partial [Manis javanica]
MGKTKGYGFISFKDCKNYVCAMHEIIGKFVGLHPTKIYKNMWNDQNLKVVLKQQKEEKLGL